MNILRFACGAESPPYKGSFPEWVQKEIKSVMSGYALGHRRNDGRYRVIVFDLNGSIKSPRMPDGGGPASCLSCPCAKAAGMKKLNAVPLDPRHGRRIIVTCYPEEVSVDATRKVAPATPDVAGATPRVAEIRSCFLHGDYTGQEECPQCLERRAKRERERSEK